MPDIYFIDFVIFQHFNRLSHECFRDISPISWRILHHDFVSKGYVEPSGWGYNAIAERLHGLASKVTASQGDIIGSAF